MEGIIYKIIIDTFLRKSHGKASGLIENNASVIDIACGNGTLAFMHAKRASQVTGIDLAEKAIRTANRRLSKLAFRNIEFIEMDAGDLSRFSNNQFDYATISLAVHQFKVETGIDILRQMSRIAKNIIILDYNYPIPSGINGLIVKTAERLAGTEHNRNFRYYLLHGGIEYFTTKAGLEIRHIENTSSVFKIVVC
jgi:ubiquinone/menaquinone biosynthesis C-methylase UbiE